MFPLLVSQRDVTTQVNKAAFPHVERADVVLAEHVT